MAGYKRRQLIGPDDLSPQALSYITEYVGLNMPPITSGQMLGAARYAWQIDVDATQQVVQASTAETVIYTTSLGGGTLGTQGCVRLLLNGTYLNSSGSASTLELKVTYGGTLMYEDLSTSLASATNRAPLIIQLDLAGADLTNAQTLHGFQYRSDRTTAPSTGLGPLDQPGNVFPIYGTAAVDSTVNQTLEVKVQHSNNSASTSYHKNYALLTKIGH